MKKKTQEATKLMKAGESSLKTGIFKWKPNYLEATPKFMEASTLFENAEDYVNALKCYEKLALCSEKQEELSGAAEAYEKMGMIYIKHMKDPKAGLNLFKKAASMYKIQNNNLRAQDILKKLGKQCFEMGHEDLGGEIFKEIINELFDDQDYGTGAEIIPSYQNYLISKERYADAIMIYEKHMNYLKSIKKYPYLVERCWLSIICIHIIIGEVFIADDKMGNFSADITSIKSSDEYSAALNLIDAIQTKDSALFNKILKRPIFTQLEIELVKKLKKFKMTQKEEVKKAPQLHNELFGNIGKPKAPVEDLSLHPEPSQVFEEDKKAILYSEPPERKEVEEKKEEKEEEEEENKLIGQEVEQKEEQEVEQKEEVGKEGESNENKPNDQTEPSKDYGGIFL